MMMLGFYGHSNSGKTTLIEKLVAKYRSRGLTVAVVKHTAHRGFELDSEGTDSWRHAKAGAAAVGLLADGRAAVMVHRMTAGKAAGAARGKDLPADAALLVKLVSEAVRPDILFLEGFKHAALDKVAVGDIPALPGTVLRVDPKKASDRRTLARFVHTRLRILRISDRLPGVDCGKCGLDCAPFAAAVAAGNRKLSDCENLSDVRLRISVDGQEIRLGRFPKEMVASALLGLVAPLKLPGGKGAAGARNIGRSRLEITLEQ